MSKDKQVKSFIFFGRSGCLLPLLIIFNLLWGWIFLKPRVWLITEGILILLFIINVYIIRRKIVSARSRRDDIIDVKGEVVEDKKTGSELFSSKK